ncbi:esterase-like activity of phytase family protein [Pseudoruegeria sp. HB172150]|uniref:esterase-like activity of phytase family protein n=1 Tax=Pseudoruegeria sp. HB172150 TaxID=2721164 RepID=UPI001554276C|nr:esterase-like activity of phytase family protein [Pseudoruegeria sp. HB172150]
MNRTICTALATFLAMPAFAQDAPPTPEFLGQIVVPSGLSVAGVVFGGISDLAYDAEGDRFLAISDDRVQNGPARFYELKLGLAEGIVSLDLAAMHELAGPNGAFAEKGTDPEGIAFDGTHLFWSSERDENGRPAIYMAAPDGSAPEPIALPEAYLPDTDNTRGIYNNLGFEGLTLTSDDKLIAGTENALAQDGRKATLESGSPARLLVIDPTTMQPAAEYLYVTEPISIEATQDPFWNDNGLSAIEAMPDGRLVTVERTFALGVGNHIRFFIADMSGADDISGTASVDPAAVTSVTKTPWFEIREGDFGLDIDNIESFAFGPVIDGKQTFVIASDDNFNPASQFTQFAVFAIPAE